MTLSVETLNQRSPYSLTQLGDLIFRYYAGILMRHDHPLHDMILAYYQDFLKHVPQLYAPREK